MGKSFNKKQKLKPSNKKLGHLRYGVIVWLVIGGLINYIDRSNLSLAAPKMMADIHINNTAIGLMGTVFSWAYAISQLPTGWLIDKFGARKIYSIGMFLWSIADAATGAMNHLWSLLTGRAILGISEAPCWPSSGKITADWFPKKERSLATGFWDSSSKLGPAIAPPIITAILVPLGWRSLFFITGILGMIFAVAFHFTYHTPRYAKHITKTERNYIEEGSKVAKTKTVSKVPWGALFKKRSVWGMILGFFCYIWIFNIFVYFMPLYLTKAFHTSQASLGIYASIPWIGGIVGAIGGGWLAKKMVEKFKMSALTSKRLMIVISAIVGGVLVVVTPFSKSVGMALAFMTIALAFLSSVSSNAWALPGDVGPESTVGSLGSIQNFGGYLGGALSPTVAGLIVDITNSYTLVFVSGGIVAALSALCYWFILKKPILDI